MDLNDKLAKIANIQIKKEFMPKKTDYILDGPSFTTCQRGGWVIKNEPIFMFKKDSKIRKLGEKILFDYDLSENYTLLLVHSLEWYSTFLVVEKDRYKDIFS